MPRLAAGALTVHEGSSGDGTESARGISRKAVTAVPGSSRRLPRAEIRDLRCDRRSAIATSGGRSEKGRVVERTSRVANTLPQVNARQAARSSEDSITTGFRKSSPSISSASRPTRGRDEVRGRAVPSSRGRRGARHREARAAATFRRFSPSAHGISGASSSRTTRRSGQPRAAGVQDVVGQSQPHPAFGCRDGPRKVEEIGGNAREDQRSQAEHRGTERGGAISSHDFSLEDESLRQKRNHQQRHGEAEDRAHAVERPEIPQIVEEHLADRQKEHARARRPASGETHGRFRAPGAPCRTRPTPANTSRPAPRPPPESRNRNWRAGGVEVGDLDVQQDEEEDAGGRAQDRRKAVALRPSRSSRTSDAMARKAAAGIPNV